MFKGTVGVSKGTVPLKMCLRALCVRFKCKVPLKMCLRALCVRFKGTVSQGKKVKKTAPYILINVWVWLISGV